MALSISRRIRVMLIPVSILCSSLVMAADIQAGKAIVEHGNGKGATACIACHGLNGAGNAPTAYPRLAGLNASYIIRQLHDFATGKRVNSTMPPFARALSEREIENVAAYFSSLKPQAATGHADASQVEVGKNLVERGAWDEGVPACIQCHGPSGRGVGERFPSIAGQNARYLETQLNDWKAGVRKNDPLNLMGGIATRLSEGQIKSVAAYLSTLNPTH